MVSSVSDGENRWFFWSVDYFFSSSGVVGFVGSSFGRVFSMASLRAVSTVCLASVSVSGFSFVSSFGIIVSTSPVLLAVIVASGVMTCMAGSCPGGLIITVFFGSSFPVITLLTLEVIVLEVVSIMRGAHFSSACDCIPDISRVSVSLRCCLIRNHITVASTKEAVFCILLFTLLLPAVTDCGLLGIGAGSSSGKRLFRS